MNIEFLNLLKYHKKGTSIERRKIEGMNQFKLKYIHTLKCHNETPCIAILNKQKFHFLFYKNGEQEGKTGPVWRAGNIVRGEDIRKGCRR
jgi:hypothetical protein